MWGTADWNCIPRLCDVVLGINLPSILAVDAATADTGQTLTQRDGNDMHNRGGSSGKVPLVLALLLLAGLFVNGLWLFQQANRLLLAPMIGALDNCLFAKQDSHSRVACRGESRSAVHLVESTLNRLGPQRSADGHLELGYTLNVPLLRLFHRATDGSWLMDKEAVRRVANTIREVERPMVLYLFSTHFGVGGEMETHLAADSANLAYTQSGPLPKDKYYNVEILPWSVARTDNEVTLRRSQAMKAILDEVCELPYAARQRVRAVTVLGEVHQLFPRFEVGMGFESDYQISDYSYASVQGFQQFVKDKFKSVSGLNAFLGADYASFSEVTPPALDIRKHQLTRYQDHIDAYAGGSFPVSGWISVKGVKSQDTWVHVFLNGEQVARVPARFGRQDVRAAKPDIGSADVGWRHDIDFSKFTPGLYRIDLALQVADGPLQYLGRRTVGVIDRRQSPPADMPQKPLPLMEKPGAEVQFFVDSPADHLSVYFNPLVPIWHDFRAMQVSNYLKYMGDFVKDSCLSGRGFTHQILPFANPGWDDTRFAIGDSLLAGHGLRLGISLYGEPIYGDSFLSWLKGTKVPTGAQSRKGLPRAYGVTEFHPLRGMTDVELGLTLERHRMNGAQFVSFFMEPRWQGELIEPGMNIFSIDPANAAQAGSADVYEAFSALLRR